MPNFPIDVVHSRDLTQHFEKIPNRSGGKSRCLRGRAIVRMWLKIKFAAARQPILIAVIVEENWLTT